MSSFRQKRVRSQLTDITPLIDVVFLLLIFFMLTTTFAKETAINIELPQAKTDLYLQKPHEIHISIDQKGRFFVDDRLLANQSEATLERALQSVAKDQRDLPVRILGDAKAPAQGIVTALEAAGKLGFKHIQIGAMLPSETSS